MVHEVVLVYCIDHCFLDSTHYHLLSSIISEVNFVFARVNILKLKGLGVLILPIMKIDFMVISDRKENQI